MTFFDTLALWTEKNWLECGRPHDLLYFLDEKASDRKLRLFGSACVRQLWHELKEQSPERKGVEIAERFADGLADRSELRRINKKLGEMCWGPQPNWGICTGAVWELTAQPRSRFGIRRASETAGMVAFKTGALGSDPIRTSSELPTLDAAVKVQANIVRDLFGNPFRPVVLPPPCWAGETPCWQASRSRSMIPGRSSASPFWPTPSMRPAAPTRRSSITCAVQGPTRAAAGSLIIFWESNEQPFHRHLLPILPAPVDLPVLLWRESHGLDEPDSSQRNRFSNP